MMTTRTVERVWKVITSKRNKVKMTTIVAGWYSPQLLERRLLLCLTGVGVSYFSVGGGTMALAGETATSLEVLVR